MTRMLGGKAKNLAILSTIHGINVPRFVVFPAQISHVDRKKIVLDFLRIGDVKAVAVRSSAKQEDSAQASFAGLYTTKLNVPADVVDITNAIDEIVSVAAAKAKVISHYADQRNLDASDMDISVIVQEMIDADLSGVIFSHDLTRRDGYYVVSTSNGVGEDIVSGSTNGELVRIVRQVKLESIKELWLGNLITAMRAIEQHYQSDSLDVEFAFKNGVLYILQCRPITTVQHTLVDGASAEKRLADQINLTNTKLNAEFGGDVLGDMIDINPLELLGENPTTLDISIFKHLFADQIVERVRRDMGYDPLDVGLLRVIDGKPYVSLKATAFSFRPNGISNTIYDRMVAVYRDALTKNPGLQNRVEFDVYAMSCGDKLEYVMRNARLGWLEKRTVRKAFKHLDSAFIKISDSLSGNLEKIYQEYEAGTKRMKGRPLRDILAHVAVGTESFVKVARLAFYWKNKFQEMYPQEDLNELISGRIQSVSSQLQTDLALCRNGVLPRDELVARYGHLRPGQFHVFGESYSDDPDHYLFAQMHGAQAFSSKKRQHALEDHFAFKNTVVFMQAREKMKFLFSKSLDLFISELRQVLRARNIALSEASRLTWENLEAVLLGQNSPRIQQEDHASMILPNVIIPGVTNLGVISFGEAMSSYITSSVVKGRICVLESPNAKVDVTDAIVLLPTADPGYDFLFHSKVAGIITKSGGPASHMCIRAIELQVPCCIGCGEHMYQRLTSAENAVLDCVQKQIIVLD